MAHSRALYKQGQSVSQPSWIAGAGRVTEGFKAFMLRFFEVFDDTSGRMANIGELDSRIGKVAAVPVVEEALSRDPNPAVQLPQWVSRILALQCAPQFLRSTGLIAHELRYQFILGAKVTVESHLVGSGRLRDGIDSYSLDPVLAE